MIHHMIMTADEAIEKLKSGNMRYLLMNSNSGNVSAALRKFTYEHGQHPHAIIVTCSDSRVIPETIFSAGLGELFVIRVAGNVIDDHQLGSIEYAASQQQSLRVKYCDGSRQCICEYFCCIVPIFYGIGVILFVCVFEVCGVR